MNSLKAVVAVLAVAVIGLSISLGVVLAQDDGGGDPPSSSATSNDALAGMIAAMQAQDWNGMRSYMQQYLGDDAYRGMMGSMMSSWGGSATPQSTASADALAAMIAAMQAQDWNGMYDYMRQYMGDDWYGQMMNWQAGCMMRNGGTPMMQNNGNCPFWATPAP
jgi:hypothetical protein